MAWSEGDPVLVTAKPDFKLYQRRDGDSIKFTVEYDLFDQYGGTLRGTGSRYTGRPDTDLAASVSYQLYHAPSPGGNGEYAVNPTSGVSGTSKMSFSRRSMTADIEIEIPDYLRTGHEFLVKIDAQVFQRPGRRRRLGFQRDQVCGIRHDRLDCQ